VSAATSGAELTEPPLVGAHYRLRPLRSSDYDYLYALLLSRETIWRWRYRGSTPPPDEFVRLLWNGVVCAFAICPTAEGASSLPVGIVQMYNADFRCGFGYLALAIDPGEQKTGLVYEGVMLFLEYAFRTWDFHKICVDIPEFNLPSLRGAFRRILTEEGRLTKHDFVDGRHWDVIQAAVHRDRWMEVRGHYLALSRLDDG
jgi:RimJ/RimL family protein N-acetyltransferase